jgi:hypothetical protein
MSEILLPEGVTPDEDAKLTPTDGEKLKYKATEADEERFFLMYHMNIQPSEAEVMSEDYRRWLIARFVAQKNMEQEMMERQQLMRKIGPTLKV